MVGRDTDMRSALLDHLCNRAKNAERSAKWRVDFHTAANTVKMAEQLVRSVDEVDNHFFLRFLRPATSSVGDELDGSVRLTLPDTQVLREEDIVGFRA